MGRPRKPLISHRATLEAALKIIDKEGLDALSIRRLGRELNVQGISLYHHFKSKEDILIGVCELALAKVRTPRTTVENWPEWLLQNTKQFRLAISNHPHLMPILMRRHPLRIGLAEQNATAGLLAVQGVPPEAIMPLLQVLEALALGIVNYQSAVEKDEHPESWREDFPFLYVLNRKTTRSDDEIFDLVVRATIKAFIDEFQIRTPAEKNRSGKTGRKSLNAHN